MLQICVFILNHTIMQYALLFVKKYKLQLKGRSAQIYDTVALKGRLAQIYDTAVKHPKKNFRGSAPNPTGGLRPPGPPLIRTPYSEP